MQPQGDDLAGVVDSLRQSVRALEARVAALEGAAARHPEAHVALAETTESSDAERTAPGGFDPVGLAAVLGQGLLGLAGAYLLRALTEQGIMSALVGYSAGALYAAAWLLLIARSGAGGAPLRAAVFGAVACSVAYPLIWEATSRVHLLGPVASATALVAMTGAALLVASHIRLQALAWVVVSCAVTTTVALMPEATRLVPLLVFTIGLGIATLWLGYVRDWFALRWPMAVVANLLVCWVVFGVPPGRGLETPAMAVGLGLLLTASYLGSILVRTLWRARDVLPFEVVQGFTALAIGIGGALALGREGGALAVGAVTLLFGAGCYVASAFVARQRGISANFHFYTTMALALVTTGILLVSAPAGAAVALSVCLAVSGGVGARRALPTLMAHAAAYAIGAALISGLASGALTAMVAAPSAAAWPSLGGTTAMLAVVCAGTLAVPRPDPAEWPFPAKLARSVVLGVAVAGFGAWTIALAMPLATTATTVDPGALATLRSVVIAGAAVLLALLTRRRGFGEAVWLAYAALAVGAVKLPVEDFPASRPATLFLALAAYGVALMAAPRLARRPA